MKSKLWQLEEEGINPTREHVRTQLDNIKNLTLEEKPLGARPHRTAVKVVRVAQRPPAILSTG
jgi:hypothetical protein